VSDDAEDGNSRPPLLYDLAPDFSARTTLGDKSLSMYRGKWLLFFSHPADFTPVCASEFVAFAGAAERFRSLNCELLALSVDSLFSHLAWLRAIQEQFGVEVPFPIIEDPSMSIARAYGMINKHSPDSALVRAAFLIDPQGIIRAITWYPMTTGRNVGEWLRLVCAIQTTDLYNVSTPEGWQPGQDVLLPVPRTAEGIYRKQEPGSDWYFKLGRPSKSNEGSKEKRNARK
jgi:peroxiredoxin 2/4